MYWTVSTVMRYGTVLNWGLKTYSVFVILAYFDQWVKIME